MAKGEANKAKTARRVIEVFEYFDGQKRHATVMDIVRRYKRPQSSTSELMASLVEMGLLYKDPVTRSYTPTPRAAILGMQAQPSVVRDGRLWAQMDKLSEETGLGLALMGMVGLNVQVFHCVAGARASHAALRGGAQERLVDSAAGLLLLSTLPAERRDGMLRRLNAEAAAERKFNHAALREAVEACGRQGHADGALGFDCGAQICATLLPIEAEDRPLALGFVYPPGASVQIPELISILRRSVQGCGGASIGDTPSQEPISSAA